VTKADHKVKKEDQNGIRNMIKR